MCICLDINEVKVDNIKNSVNSRWRFLYVDIYDVNSFDKITENNYRELLIFHKKEKCI